MKLNPMGTVAAIIVAVLTVGAGGFKAVVWAGDQRYVTEDKLSIEFRKRRVQDLIDRIDYLEIKVKLEQATKLDEAELESLKRKLQQITILE